MLKGHFYLKSLFQDAISSFAACLYCHRSAVMLPGCKCVGLLPRLNFSVHSQPCIDRRFENSQKNATFDKHDPQVVSMIDGWFDRAHQSSIVIHGRRRGRFVRELMNHERQLAMYQSLSLLISTYALIIVHVLSVD